MKQLVDGVEKLVKAEYEQAIENHGYHHSAHEGLAVLWEEVQEAEHEFERVKSVFDQIKGHVFADNFFGPCADGLKKAAILTAAECIQVAAMAEKLKASNIVNTSEEVASNALDAYHLAKSNWRNYGGKEDEE